MVARATATPRTGGVRDTVAVKRPPRDHVEHAPTHARKRQDGTACKKTAPGEPLGSHSLAKDVGREEQVVNPTRGELGACLYKRFQREHPQSSVARRPLDGLTKYERVRLLGARSAELCQGSRALVSSVPSQTDTLQTACEELQKGLLCRVVVRVSPSGERIRYSLGRDGVLVRILDGGQ